MLILSGSHAFSPFRIQKKCEELKKISSKIHILEAISMYFIHDNGMLSDTHKQLLQTLLDGKVWQECKDEKSTLSIIVVPRKGTLSPWASKAADIAHNCGLLDLEAIERGIFYRVYFKEELSLQEQQDILLYLHDPLTQSVLNNMEEANTLFTRHVPLPFKTVPQTEEGKSALFKANREWGLALSDDEIDYLFDNFQRLNRDPTDVELMMFAQANSEHCRHKIFNGEWTIDGVKQEKSLFSMIKNTYECHQEGVLSAYKDNSSVIAGYVAERFFLDAPTKCYQTHQEPIHILMKVETHNHPTAISPYSGAATGSGGEIRDEGATGCGAKPKAGLTGFSVSNLAIPGFEQPWEHAYGKPKHISSALKIMLEAPIGGAAFNNEFGRPNICGYFRTFEQHFPGSVNAVRGYHKPIMIAGGLGNIREQHIVKKQIPENALLIVLGGPALQIGLGGGAASSMSAGTSEEKLDFASVQRDNAEMQRRCQEVIDHCWSLGEDNPIYSIHDVGAGGLSNALPELINDSERGGEFDLRKIDNADKAMSPMALWCNESQERYVLAIKECDLPFFDEMAKRERCPYAVVGRATQERHLQVTDPYFNNCPVSLPLNVIFGKPPKMSRDVTREVMTGDTFTTTSIALDEAITRVLHLPTVADKRFLITIGDRTVSGLVARDQMVGPWQIPVSDCAVTASSFSGYQGEAMAMGERCPVALLNPQASGRLAVAEAITNIAAADITELENIKLSANWMAACGQPGEDAALFDTVQAVAMELCPALSLTIPVGKDSLSMRSQWKDGSEEKSVTSPLSLIISAFAPVHDIRKTLTPELDKTLASELLLIDLGQGKNRLGASALASVYKQFGQETPDVDSPQLIKQFFKLIQTLKQENMIHAYHDRSDGGLIVTLLEMAFASHCGLTIQLKETIADPIAALFSEELGAVIQIAQEQQDAIFSLINTFGLLDFTSHIGTLAKEDTISIYHGDKAIFKDTRIHLQSQWSETSYQMQAIRDNSICAKQEYDALLDGGDPGLHAKLTYSIDEDISAPYLNVNKKPLVAILREQGVNGHFEMAAAFMRAGFEAMDVHMSDIIEGRITLAPFVGLAACGGFSYGDVLGAGNGWAKTILYNDLARSTFSDFFLRKDTFAIGVCNGCQMFANIQELIPGTDNWPHFSRNISEQYEARLVMVEVQKSPSILFQGMEGSRMPIVVAHGEGFATFASEECLQKANTSGLVALRFVDHYGKITQQFPFNPNGSPDGITALTNQDGRFTLMMPHPERIFRTVQMSWHPKDWHEDSPWMRLFRNARTWVA